MKIKPLENTYPFLFLDFFATESDVALNGELIAETVDTGRLVALCGRRIEELKKCIGLAKKIEAGVQI